MDDCFFVNDSNALSHYWIWCPVMGPLFGGLFGGCIYDVFLYTGDDNVLVKPYVVHRLSSGLGV